MPHIGTLELTGEREDSLVQVTVTSLGNLEVREQRWAMDNIGQHLLVNHRYVLEPGDTIPDDAPDRVKVIAAAIWTKDVVNARWVRQAELSE